MAVTLYKRQREILDFISQFIQKYEYAPTLNEIAKAMGVKSLATIHEHLTALEKKGILRRGTGEVRSIEIMEEAKEKALGLELPVLGFIAAGKPIEPHTDPNASLHVAPATVSGKKRAFVLQVKGNSMVDEGILDGDYVVIEEQTDVQDGDIVVAILENGFATLKRFFKESTRVRLEPANSQMSPIFARNVRIQGRVVSVVRRYNGE